MSGQGLKWNGLPQKEPHDRLESDMPGDKPVDKWLEVIERQAKWLKEIREKDKTKCWHEGEFQQFVLDFMHWTAHEIKQLIKEYEEGFHDYNDAFTTLHKIYTVHLFKLHLRGQRLTEEQILKKIK